VRDSRSSDATQLPSRHSKKVSSSWTETVRCARRTTRPYECSAKAARGSRGCDLHRVRRGATRSDGHVLTDELPIAAALERDEMTTNVVLGVRDDEGRDQWLSVSARPLEDQEEHEAAVVCSISDITDRKQLMDRLAWEARHDPLTGSQTGRVSSRLRSGRTICGTDRSVDGAVLLRSGPLQARKRLARPRGRKRSAAHHRREAATAMPTALALCRLHGDEFAALEPVSATRTPRCRGQKSCAHV